MDFNYAIELCRKEDQTIRVLYTSTGLTDRRKFVKIPIDVFATNKVNNYRPFIIRSAPVLEWAEEQQAQNVNIGNIINTASSVNTSEYSSVVSPEIIKTTEDYLADLAKKRYKIETGGYIWNSWLVDSDDRAQFKAFAEAMAIQEGTRTDGELWKFKDGVFRPLTNDQFLQLFGTGRAFITKCYNIESTVKDRIIAGETDVDTLWGEEWAK